MKHRVLALGIGVLVACSGVFDEMAERVQDLAQGRRAEAASAESDTPWTVERPLPSVSYGTYSEARRHFEKLMRRTLGAYADSAVWLRTETDFLYRDRVTLERSIRGNLYWAVNDRPAASHVPALVVTLRARRAGISDVIAIADTLQAAGWAEDGAYSADGPDGTAFAYVCREALCFTQAAWDGGGESDTTYVPAPGVYVQIICMPRVP